MRNVRHLDSRNLESDFSLDSHCSGDAGRQSGRERQASPMMIDRGAERDAELFGRRGKEEFLDCARSGE